MRTVRSQISFWMGIAMPVPACAAVAWAHPGHSLAQARPAHLLSSPDHAVALVALAALLYLLSGFVSRTKLRRSLQWCALALLMIPLVLPEV